MNIPKLERETRREGEREGGEIEGVGEREIEGREESKGERVR
jgi:hypothetical protein